MHKEKKLKHIISTIIVISNILGYFLTTAQAAEVLVYRNESMPWCATVSGKDAGITIDILREITKHGGPKFIFKSLPWARAQRFVQKKPGTAIVPFTRTSERETNHTWIVNLVPNQIRLTLNRKPVPLISIPSPLTLENAKHLPIGVILGSAIIPYMRKEGFTNLKLVPTAEQNVRKLAKGRIAAMAESKWVDNYLWNQIGENSDDLIAGPNIGETKHIYLAAALNFSPELTKQIRDAMNKVKESATYEQILNKWTQF